MTFEEVCRVQCRKCEVGKTVKYFQDNYPETHEHLTLNYLTRMKETKLSFFYLDGFPYDGVKVLAMGICVYPNSAGELKDSPLFEKILKLRCLDRCLRTFTGRVHCDPAQGGRCHRSITVSNSIAGGRAVRTWSLKTLGRLLRLARNRFAAGGR